MAYRDIRKKNAWYRAWRAKNPEKAKARDKLEYARKRARFLQKHPRPESCEICGQGPKEKLHADHKHRTGKFRGWLCGTCNRLLGMAYERASILRAAVVYLRRKA